MIEISDRLENFEWIPRPKITALRRLGMETVENVLTHYPRRYEDRHEFPHFPREESDRPICLCGEVTKTSLRRFGGWKKIFEATLEESNSNALSEPLTLRWFNLHYVQKMIATGQRLVVFGKPRLRGKRICLEHPEFEVIEDDEEISIHFRRITPIYPATEGVSQRLLRSIIHRVLTELSDEPLETFLPSELDRTERRLAINQIHFPDNWESLAQARNHLVLAEFFAMQMMIASRRSEAQSRSGGAHAGRGELLDRFVQALPFELTAAQKKVIAEIRRDLAAPYPMNRLLQGDVGSGKTVVGIAAMLLAIEAGYQSAFMAPTQILAEQHYAVLRRWLEPLGVRLSLRTGARQEESGPLPLFESAQNQSANSSTLGSARLQRAGDGILPSRTSADQQATSGASYSKRRLPDWTPGDQIKPESSSPQNAATSTLKVCAPQIGPSLPTDTPHIIVGTHALLYEGVVFSNLGLVVIDEQHKFGVAQRARLTSREPAPDVLVMTATPIPRTLTMTVYGDLDVSMIEEMPKGRGQIVTAVRETAKLGDVLMFLRKQLEAGRQAYVVYPLIDESEKLDVKAAAKEFEEWQERLRPFRCELLHGRISPDEKQKVMDRFRKGETNVLVSTTVIEVGVDVSNATVMLIENAERFGLAQLHQLRGRIGRGSHKSYCVLLTNDVSPETTAKLAVLERTTNGFEVAEADWELRGPGDLLGTAQSGLPALRIGNLKSDAKLMQTARQAAASIFASDRGLERPENQRFRPLIVEEQGRSFANVS